MSTKIEVAAGDEASLMAAMARLADKLEWYRSIIDAVPFPIHVIDMDMKWTYLNTAFEKLMVERGYVRDRQDAVGRPCSTANANICNTKNCGIQQLKIGVKESYFDWGNLKCKQDTANVVNAKGEVVGYVETVSDLTAMISVKDYTEKEVQRVAMNLERVGRGDLNLDLKPQASDQHTKEVEAQFNKIDTSLKQVGASLGALISDANMLSEAAVALKLDTRADATKHQGRFPSRRRRRQCDARRRRQSAQYVDRRRCRDWSRHASPGSSTSAATTPVIVASSRPSCRGSTSWSTRLSIRSTKSSA